MAKYRCDQIEARTDGSGMVAWDVWAIDDDGNVIPGKHKTVLTPWDETQTALSTGASALKVLLVKYAAGGWDNDALNDEVAMNLNSANVVTQLEEFVDGVGGFPVEFNL